MGTRTTKEIIEDLEPAQVVGVVEELYDIIFTHVPSDVLDNARNDAAVRDLVAIGARRPQIGSADHVLHRQILIAYAQDPNLEPVVVQALETVLSAETLSIGTVVAVGLLINLTLFVATTAVVIKKDAGGVVTWQVSKTAASPQLVKTVIDPLAKLAIAGQ